MSSPTLNQTDFALISETLTPAISDDQSSTRTREASALLTTRSIMAVSLLGAGFWFVLWKLAMYLFISR